MGIMAKCANGHVLRVKDEFAGKSGLCPHCRARVFVPMPIREKSRISDDEILGLLGQAAKPSCVAVAAPPSDSVLDINNPIGPAADTAVGSPTSLGSRKVNPCPGCGHLSSTAFTYCPRCGAPLPRGEKATK
jgi:hypothetical protein